MAFVRRSSIITFCDAVCGRPAMSNHPISLRSCTCIYLLTGNLLPYLLTNSHQNEYPPAAQATATIVMIAAAAMFHHFHRERSRRSPLGVPYSVTTPPPHVSGSALPCHTSGASRHSSAITPFSTCRAVTPPSAGIRTTVPSGSLNVPMCRGSFPPTAGMTTWGS